MIEKQYLNEMWLSLSFKDPMVSGACEILQIINDLGFEAYIIGGAVRDFIMEEKIKDVDICTNCPIEVLESFFDCHDIGKSKTFGIVAINHEGITYEIAQFRKDIGGNGRKPDNVNTCIDFKEDTKRRDFTINAMAIDCCGNFIDNHNGYKDIKENVIRAIGSPSDRFKEDYLRILRAIRFSARYNFYIETETLAAVQKYAKKMVEIVSPERIKDELWGMASQNGMKFADALVRLDAYGILEHILPEVVAMKNVKETIMYHPEAYLSGDGSVFYHIIEAIRKNKKKDPIINMAILFHDIAKPLTHIERGFNHTFYGHAEQAKEVIDNIADRLRFSNEEKNHIVFAAVNHMKLFRGEVMRPSKIVRMVNHPSWPILKEVSYCDDACRIGLFNEENFFNVINNMETITKEWNEKNKNSNKIIDGKRVMEITKLPQGKEVGNIIRLASEYCIDNNITDKKDIDGVITMIYTMCHKEK